MNPRRCTGPAAALALMVAGAVVCASAGARAQTAVRGMPIGATASGTSRPSGARAIAPHVDARPALPPYTIDSLATDHIPRGFIAARDVNSLTRLRREVEYAANQFRRYVGAYPPPIRIAAVGDIDPARVDPARLRGDDGVDFVVTDWPEPAKPGAPPSTTWISDRIARWDLEACERKNATGTPSDARSRLTPDWFASAIAGLATPPAEQERRFQWMRAHMDRRIPIPQFLDMTRPAEGPAAQAAMDTHPGPMPPIRVPAPREGVARLPVPVERPTRGKPSHHVERRGGAAAAVAEQQAQLFDCEALAFARFLGAREDERVLGLWYQIVLAGKPQSEAFNIAKTMLSNPIVLEKEWVSWMKNPEVGSGQ